MKKDYFFRYRIYNLKVYIFGGVTVNKWNAVYVNDPNNDYNLKVELECNNKEMGYIKKINDKLEVVFYSSLKRALFW